MNYRIATALVLASAVFATTECRAQDTWMGRDKQLHLGASAAIAGAVTLATGDERLGFAASLAVGVAKELYDKRHPGKHTASFKDLAADAAGAYIGAKLGGMLVIPQKGGFEVRLVRSF